MFNQVWKLFLCLTKARYFWNIRNMVMATSNNYSVEISLVPSIMGIVRRLTNCELIVVTIVVDNSLDILNGGRKLNTNVLSTLVPENVGFNIVSHHQTINKFSFITCFTSPQIQIAVCHERFSDVCLQVWIRGSFHVSVLVGFRS